MCLRRWSSWRSESAQHFPVYGAEHGIATAIALRPPQQLVALWHTPPQSSFPGMKQFPLSAANYLDWERQNHVFSQTAIASYTTMNLTGKGEPVSLPTDAVSRNFFPCCRRNQSWVGHSFPKKIRMERTTQCCLAMHSGKTVSLQTRILLASKSLSTTKHTTSSV